MSFKSSQRERFNMTIWQRAWALVPRWIRLILEGAWALLTLAAPKACDAEAGVKLSGQGR